MHPKGTTFSYYNDFGTTLVAKGREDQAVFACSSTDSEDLWGNI